MSKWRIKFRESLFKIRGTVFVHIAYWMPKDLVRFCLDRVHRHAMLNTEEWDNDMLQISASDLFRAWDTKKESGESKNCHDFMDQLKRNKDEWSKESYITKEELDMFQKEIVEPTLEDLIEKERDRAKKGRDPIIFCGQRSPYTNDGDKD